MKTFTVYSAAKECGTSRPTLLRAIKTGSLKATFDEENGQWQINLPDLLAAGFNPGKPTAPPDENNDHESSKSQQLQRELEICKIRLTSSEQMVRMQQQLIKVQEKSLEDLRTTLKALTPPEPSAVSKPRHIDSAQFSANFSAKFPTQIINRACRLIRPRSLRRAKSTPQQQLDQPTH